MRRFIFILMIALLPLRGWMGEAMATEMAATKFTTAKSVKMTSEVIVSHGKSMVDVASPVTLAGCDTHADQASDQDTAAESCTHCQACHAAALVETVQLAELHPHINILPQVYATHPGSADRQLSQKPPIL